MAYLHCHSCGWEQDDFYSVDYYNPVNSLKDWMSDLCNRDIDAPFTNCASFIAENGNLTLREVIAREFEKYADNIRNMKWVTSKQWERDKANAVCPKCGSRELDVD
jgi:hypothetical protein